MDSIESLFKNGRYLKETMTDNEKKDFCELITSLLEHTNSLKMNYKLCYVDSNYAWFTDNFNGIKNQDILQEKDYYIVMYRSELHATLNRYDNIKISEVNSGKYPWLSSDTIFIHSGISLQDFIHKIKESNGQVYLPVD